MWLPYLTFHSNFFHWKDKAHRSRKEIKNKPNGHPLPSKLALCAAGGHCWLLLIQSHSDIIIYRVATLWRSWPEINRALSLWNCGDFRKNWYVVSTDTILARHAGNMVRAHALVFTLIARLLWPEKRPKSAHVQKYIVARLCTQVKNNKNALVSAMSLRFLFLFTRATFDARTKPLTSAIHALCVSVEVELQRSSKIWLEKILKWLGTGSYYFRWSVVFFSENQSNFLLEKYMHQRQMRHRISSNCFSISAKKWRFSKIFWPITVYGGS